ncbi:MAG TPA: hypothetical protein VLC46_18340 [Thermoanaerobaculia bacterium]|nr:hypothetical protein [Thermoanaerobaculia bacterium]
MKRYPRQASPVFLASALFALLFALLATLPAAAQDAVTVGTVTASGNTVDVPVYIRDKSATPLGRDQPAGSKIQSYTLTVDYAPAASVQSVTFTRAGITAGLTLSFEVSPAAAGQISLLDDFQESTNLIPFNLNTPLPGDQVAHLVFTLAGSAAPGSSITLTLDAQTQLTDQGGTAATAENSGNGQLTLVNGAINIPQLSLNILPGTRTIATGGTTTFTAATSGNVVSDTTVSLVSTNPSVATVPASAVIPAGSSSVDFTVTGTGIGSANINGSLAGGATASAFITVTEPCLTPASPSISGPATANVGTAYTITWASISGATDYEVDESTDPNFGTQTTLIVTTTSATFTHTAANRYYYHVRARTMSSGCTTFSPFSAATSVLVSVAPVAQTRYLPVVGSTPGNFGSFFKTAVQLYNVKSSAISGKIVFHTQNTSGSSTDPSLAFSIQPGKTLSYPDLLPAMGVASGLGTADLIADAGSAFPITLVRVFNDAGTAGTTGLAEEPMDASEALQSGQTGALIAPADQKFRLNIGVRTLEQGASMTLTVRDKDGNVVKTTTKSYGPTFFTQVGSSTMLDGYVLAGGETITIQVTAGSAFIYGSTTDNTTQDPSVQFANPIE